MQQFFAFEARPTLARSSYAQASLTAEAWDHVSSSDAHWLLKTACASQTHYVVLAQRARRFLCLPRQMSGFTGYVGGSNLLLRSVPSLIEGVHT